MFYKSLYLMRGWSSRMPHYLYLSHWKYYSVDGIQSVYPHRYGIITACLLTAVGKLTWVWAHPHHHDHPNPQHLNYTFLHHAHYVDKEYEMKKISIWISEVNSKTNILFLFLFHSLSFFILRPIYPSKTCGSIRRFGYSFS